MTRTRPVEQGEKLPMVMDDPDIKRAIDKIEQKIARLRRLKDALTDEFGKDETTIAPNQKTGDSGGRRTNRKQQVIAFLISHGPSKRKDIVDGTGVPAGSVSDVLRDKKTFRLLPDGTWDVQEHLKTGAAKTK